MRKIIFTFIFLFFTLNVHADEYHRIISLSPAVTEIMYSLGIEDKLIGVSNYCDYPDAARSKPRVGGFINPSLEKIIGLGPDLVIVSKNSGTKALAKKLEEFDIPMKIVSFYSLSDLLEAFRLIGALGDVPEEAEARIDQFTELVKLHKDRTRSVNKKKVLFVRWHSPLSIAGSGSLEDEIIDVIGGFNVAGTSKTRYANYTIEAILLANPDVIIDATFYDTPTTRQKKNIASFWQQWPSLSAVKEGEVYIIKTDLHSVPGPRTMQFIDEMAWIVYPDLFENKWGLSEKIDV